MKVVYKKIEELIEYKNNPRVNKDAVQYVANSIKQFGFSVPILIDKNNVIIAGHTRKLAAKQLNMKQVPCVVKDELTDEQVKALRIADNKVQEFSYWNDDLLVDELDSLLKIDMSLFGFSDDWEDDEFDYSQFFEEQEDSKEKESKLIVCPHCGKPIDN